MEDSDLILEQIDKIGGWIKFMFCVEPKLALKFLILWTNILTKYNLEISPEKPRKGHLPLSLRLDKDK